MSNERVAELLKAAAERELSDVEHAELERLLEESPDAHRLHEGLSRMDSVLRKVPELTPPATLHDRIMAHVSLPPGERNRNSPGWFNSLTPFSLLRYGMATAAGAVLAAAFYESQAEFGGTPDIMQIVGTMAADRSRAGDKVLDTHTFRTATVKSEVSLERHKDALLLDIHVDADEPVTISFDFSAAGVRVDAIVQDRRSLESIEITEQGLRVRARGRRNLTALLQRMEDAEFTGEVQIDLDYSSDGKVLQRGALTATW